MTFSNEDTFSVCKAVVKCLSLVTYHVEATRDLWDINRVSCTHAPTCDLLAEISFCGGQSVVLVAHGGILEISKNKR